MRNYEYICNRNGLEEVDSNRHNETRDSLIEIDYEFEIESEIRNSFQIDFYQKEIYVERESLDSYYKIKKLGYEYCV